MLDTNVWLDLLLFDDPRAAALRTALEAGTVTAVADTACRDEWQRVLGYPLLALEPGRREALVAAFDAVVAMLDAPAGPPPATPVAAAALPRCRDPDDQKFLQLAHSSGARWLLSRDRHLLSLASRCRREGWFEIATPEDWAATLPL